MTLKNLPTTPDFDTSTKELIHGFYAPALKASVTYDRGVGFFTSGWLRMAAAGLASFAANGGIARLIASPKLSQQDWDALCAGAKAIDDPAIRAELQKPLAELEQALETETVATLAWMIADGLMEIRLAVPQGELDGDFHDKFGIFKDGDGNKIAFHGSPNDSERAFRNYEAISVFYSWADGREATRVEGKQARFNYIWGGDDPNLKVHKLPEAIRLNIVEITQRVERPYKKKEQANRRWRHQPEAVAAFLNKRNGILEMATGTGKTRTALSILKELNRRAEIRTCIVTAYGTDLLDQWYTQLLDQSPYPVYRAYEKNEQALQYLNDPNQCLLLTSRQQLGPVLTRLPPIWPANGLLICDEVHGLGCASSDHLRQMRA